MFFILVSFVFDLSSLYSKYKVCLDDSKVKKMSKIFKYICSLAAATYRTQQFFSYVVTG